MAAAVGAGAAVWIALLLTVLAASAAIGGLALRGAVRAHVDAAWPYADLVWPHVQRHAATLDAAFESATAPAALEFALRSRAAAARAISLFEVLLGEAPEERLLARLAKMAAWEARVDALCDDPRLAALSRASSDAAQLYEARGSHLVADFVDFSNMTHSFILRQTRRLRALEAVLTD